MLRHCRRYIADLIDIASFRFLGGRGRRTRGAGWGEGRAHLTFANIFFQCSTPWLAASIKLNHISPRLGCFLLLPVNQWYWIVKCPIVGWENRPIASLPPPPHLHEHPVQIMPVVRFLYMVKALVFKVSHMFALQMSSNNPQPSLSEKIDLPVDSIENLKTVSYFQWPPITIGPLCYVILGFFLLSNIRLKTVTFTGLFAK